MTRIYKIMGSISALAGILLIIYMAIYGIIIKENFLNRTNEKYKVHERLSMTSEDLEKAVHGMISYVRGETQDAQVTVSINGEMLEFYNEKELSHMTDVRMLICRLNTSVTILAIFFVLCEIFLFIKKEYNSIRKGVFIAWGILVFLVGSIVILTLIDINLVVTGFHKLFFLNDNWILNPVFDRSVWMFRTNMYHDVLIYMAGIVGSLAIFSIVGAIVIKKVIRIKYIPD